MGVNDFSFGDTTNPRENKAGENGAKEGGQKELTHYVPEHDLGSWKSTSKFQGVMYRSSGSGIGITAEVF